MCNKFISYINSMSSIFGRIEPQFVTVDTSQNITGAKRFFGEVTADNPIAADISGNASTASSAITVPYSGLTGTVPTWNQNTSGNAATASNVPYTGLTGAVPTWNQNTSGNAATASTVPYSGLTGAASFSGLATFSNNIVMTGATPVLYSTNPTSSLTIQSGVASATYGIVMQVNNGVGGSCLDIIPTGATTAIITASKPVSMLSTLDVTSTATFTASPIIPTPLSTDNSTKAATTAFVKTIAAPSNFLGLANSFFNSFIYSNNPNPDYMIAGNLGGLNPVVNAAIIAPGTTSFILMGIRLQAGISFNRYGWNENAGNPLRCALYTSQYVYVPNSITAYTAAGIPANVGGKVEVTTAATVTIPTTDTYYIYMDGSGAAGGNTVYGAQSTNFNLMNYTDFASASFTLLSSTEPFKVATGVKLAAASPITTMNDLKVSNAAMTYTAYVLGVFLRIVI